MNGADRLCRRRWRFAGCVFDESNWTLVVDGRRVYVEAKPLEVLRELLLKAGQVVTKDALLDKIWPDVHVVEASLPTAIGKLRRALGDESHDIIETVSGIGYRVPVQVDLDDGSPRPSAAAAAHYATVHAEAAGASQPPSSPMARVMLVGAGLAIGLAALIVAFAPNEKASARDPGPAHEREALIAIRALDIAKVNALIAAGWNPDIPLGKEGNNALNYLIEMCEWNPKADPQKMVVLERTLIEAGAQFDRPNVWGDTAYSIAKAPRFCGPDHPVTLSLKSQCYSSNGVGGGIGDRCLATYELERMRKKAQLAAK